MPWMLVWLIGDTGNLALPPTPVPCSFPPMTQLPLCVPGPPYSNPSTRVLLCPQKLPQKATCMSGDPCTLRIS